MNRISASDRTWLIPFQSYATVLFKGNRNDSLKLYSSTSSVSFTECDGWFRSANQYEYIEVEFYKADGKYSQHDMKITLSRNPENKDSKKQLEFLDFSYNIDQHQDKIQHQNIIYVPALKKNVAVWSFENRKENRKVTQISYSKVYGIVGYNTLDGQSFVMDSVFTSPYIAL